MSEVDLFRGRDADGCWAEREPFLSPDPTQDLERVRERMSRSFVVRKRLTFSAQVGQGRPEVSFGGYLKEDPCVDLEKGAAFRAQKNA